MDEQLQQTLQEVTSESSVTSEKSRIMLSEYSTLVLCLVP